MNQERTIEQFVQMGKGSKKNIITDDCDIVGLLQKYFNGRISEDTFKGFGFVIYDECHQGLECILRALLKTNTRYTHGCLLPQNAKVALKCIWLSSDGLCCE